MQPLAYTILRRIRIYPPLLIGALMSSVVITSMVLRFTITDMVILPFALLAMFGGILALAGIQSGKLDAALCEPRSAGTGMLFPLLQNTIHDREWRHGRPRWIRFSPCFPSRMDHDDDYFLFAWACVDCLEPICNQT
jgi:hypothetical protein